MDFEKIRKHDGYVYFWTLTDSLKPTEGGYFSAKVYKQGDCKLFRQKPLSYSFHKEPMGEGTGDVSEPKGKNGDWQYLPPNTAFEEILQQVCSQ